MFVVILVAIHVLPAAAFDPTRSAPFTAFVSGGPTMTAPFAIAAEVAVCGRIGYLAIVLLRNYTEFVLPVWFINFRISCSQNELLCCSRR